MDDGWTIIYMPSLIKNFERVRRHGENGEAKLRAFFITNKKALLPKIDSNAFSIKLIAIKRYRINELLYCNLQLQHQVYLL